MQKLGLNQSLQQKLSPQQIQFIKLLQVPTAELEDRIEEELEINPALEEGEEQERTGGTRTIRRSEAEEFPEPVQQAMMTLISRTICGMMIIAVIKCRAMAMTTKITARCPSRCLPRYMSS